MSFQGKAFWMAKDGSGLNDGEMSYDGSSRLVYDNNNPSRIEPKRGQPWFLDAPESELFPNKKQAVEASNRWENISSFQTVSNHQFTDRLFGSVNNRSISQSGLNLGRDEQFGGDASIDLTMSQTMEDPGSCLSYGGIRKVKINQVKESSETLYFNQVPDSENSMSISFNQGKDPVSVGHAFNKGDSNTISFSGFQDVSDTNPSGSLISNYDLLVSQSPSESLKQKELTESNAHLSKGGTSKNKTETKVPKKLAPNTFPSNVRSLLSTGILDDIPVKYISWSREELRGVIKGSGYLCGCESCSYKKILNAYEFERHAGCKTKHPNNHIYFDNGKTIYAVVQELRSTPQNLLFEAMQTVTGSPINDKSFRSWKESFQAATRELQRIYGKEEIQDL